MSFISHLLLIVLAFAAPSSAREAGAGSVIAIVGADVLPMTRTERLQDQTVIVSGDRIVTIGPRPVVAIPAGATRVEGAGMTLMPGLVDMHVHVPAMPGVPGDEAQRAFAVMLAHGITTVRGMAGSPDNLVARAAIEGGTLAGPRFYVATQPLNDENVPDVASARAAVRSAENAGFDFIKAHHITSVPVWEALQDEARRQGLPTTGHVTNEIGVLRAAAAGQQVEHLDGAIFALLPDGAPERQIPFGQLPPPAIVAAAARTRDVELAGFAQRIATARNYQVPTLALFERLLAFDRPIDELMRAPQMRFASKRQRHEWATQREQMLRAGITVAQARTFLDLRRRIARAYAAAGVPLMTGSDTPKAFHIWGIGLIDAVEALVRAGLTPLQALRAATVNPRDYLRSLPNRGSSLGWDADFGTVERGARADLILLRGDPLRDLRALRGPEAVIAGGRLYERADLEALLNDAAAGQAVASLPLGVDDDVD
ncbi:amidohydrolase family protein [Sphingosinicella sp. LHD-64]|uniref:amidohydrolase family protein n=1 Tax=Sphingosinicella sp. LHD-64 TaxID=3072139 RepID=UPI00280F15B2|nr:amidohydrolase family protein [Sphingosinicella sp. LHD-64]MDQ8756234.1 amidohydrolase family protein [Sphingosinicella sp. LHD-64]